MIILCVTGSIAATQAIRLARDFKRNGVEIKCFMSDAACEIIHPNAMEFATGSEVVTKLTGKIEHVKYSQEDLILVAPATANTISKFAHKIADDPISTLLITAYGHNTPILFVPSMHERVAEMLATIDGAAYVERVSIDSPAQIRKARKAIERAVETQQKKLGLSFVEFLSTCPTNWGLTAPKSMEWVRERMIPYYPLGVFKKPEAIA